MRIAVIGPLELPKAQGGVTRHCEEIYARVAADGHDVTVLCAGGPSPAVVHRGMRVRRLRTASSPGWERLTYAFAASWAALRGKYDVVHYHSFASSAFCMLPKLRGRRIVTTAHRIEWQDAKWGRITRWFLRYCEWVALRCSDALVAVSQALKDDLAARHARAAEIVVISNGVTRPEPADTARLAPLGLRPHGYLLVVGRLVPEKGVDVAIDAFLGLLGSDGIDVDLAIVGGGRKAGSATEVALARQAEPGGGRVHFLGVQEPDVVAMLYDNAAALVAPSYQEGQPLVVAEAMRAGCCIIASDIPAHLELLGDTGRIFACGDAGDLGRAMQWLRSHPDDARALGERAAARIAAGSYSWDEAAAATERVLASD
ncbi:MAG TPA: glycosyltransferase family 4 protein [Acidimicrobiia bacterium]|nr:glycosyltransferase family 4 protein [Acidimicrobiia bacterium]